MKFIICLKLTTIYFFLVYFPIDNRFLNVTLNKEQVKCYCTTDTLQGIEEQIIFKDLLQSILVKAYENILSFSATKLCEPHL